MNLFQLETLFIKKVRVNYMENSGEVKVLTILMYGNIFQLLKSGLFQPDVK